MSPNKKSAFYCEKKVEQKVSLWVRVGVFGYVIEGIFNFWWTSFNCFNRSKIWKDWSQLSATPFFYQPWLRSTVLKKCNSYPFLKHLQSQFSRLCIVLWWTHSRHIQVFEFKIHFYCENFQQGVVSPRNTKRFVCVVLEHLRLINKTVCGVVFDVVYKNPRGTLKLCQLSCNWLIDRLNEWQASFAYMYNGYNEISFMEILINVFDSWKHRLGKQPQIVPIEPVNKF